MKGLIASHSHYRQHGEEPVEEDLAGEKEGVVSVIEGSQYNGIDRPAKGGSKGEQIAKRIDFNEEIAIQHYKSLSHQGYKRTYCKLTCELNLTEQEDGEQGGQQGSDADDERHI